MSDADTAERRRFNKTERTAFYLAADGKCEECGAELEQGWHADHVQPYSRGGPTDVINGQALCPQCNLRKGPRMAKKLFTPRKFQHELLEVTEGRMIAGEHSTTALVAPGGGKTKGYQYTADGLISKGLIDRVFVYAPFRNLCSQADTDWQEHDLLFGWGHLGRIGHCPNNTPILPTDLGSYVTTYQAASTNPKIHIDEAERYRGRFLLVVDEPQFLGISSDGNNGDGTVAGSVMRAVGERAAHVLAVTGSATRSDREPWYPSQWVKREDGLIYLDYQVTCTYQECVRLGYSRRFQMDLVSGDATLESLDGETEDVTIEETENRLQPILRHPKVFGPIVDKAVLRLEREMGRDRGFRGLISCMDQNHARAVMRYVEERYPKLRSVLAVSDDEKATKTLKAFREVNSADLLVTVRMAYIGYDHKPITVIGCLTHWRFEEYLRQLMGRGTRWWSDGPDDQTCWLVGPNDPRLRKFGRKMQEESETGYKEREKGPGPEPGPGPGDTFECVDAEMTETIAIGNDGELSGVELAKIEEVREKLGIGASPTQLAAFMKATNGHAAESTPTQTNGASVMTRPEEVAKLVGEIKDYANKAAGCILENGDWPTAHKKIRAQHNEEDNLGYMDGAALRELENLRRRKQTARKVYADVSS